MIHKLTIGPLQTNCYIVYDENTLQGMIVDPACEDTQITDYIEQNNIKIEKIYLTHCHFDHISGVNWLKEKYNIPVIAFHGEEEGIRNKDINLSEYVIGKEVSVTCDKLVFENDEIEVGNMVFKVIHTPGHTSGSSCLYDGDNLISGDTIFADTCGRTDLPTSSREDIMDSIMNKILILPDDTFIYPGHGKATMLKDEKPIYLELKPKMW